MKERRPVLPELTDEQRAELNAVLFYTPPKDTAMPVTYEQLQSALDKAQRETATLRAERDNAFDEYTSAELENLRRDLVDVAADRDAARAEVARLTEALATERCNTRYSEADRDEDRAKREQLKADLANAREAAAADHAAMLEARAERDNLARALAAVRAVVAMVQGEEA